MNMDCFSFCFRRKRQAPKAAVATAGQPPKKRKVGRPRKNADPSRSEPKSLKMKLCESEQKRNYLIGRMEKKEQAFARKLRVANAGHQRALDLAVFQAQRYDPFRKNMPSMSKI